MKGTGGRGPHQAVHPTRSRQPVGITAYPTIQPPLRQRSQSGSKALNEQTLTVRKAAELTGYAAADFSRIRRANLDRFTVNRLLTMLGKLGQDVEVTVIDLHIPRTTPARPEPART
ncbi:XRE family transcriptional regulator [Paeniroseomonas aquatica]|uniref:XRE family transcriptional regulator n=1 Tax=Paeniroseomonas aquatica TaxID=373043 RepID=UPI00338FFF77